MVKVLDGRESVYEPSKRSLNWLKLKKDYMDGLTDTFDLVPIAAWRGKGKRTGGYGAYLLACFDPEEEVWQAITKVGTGFSDEMLAELTKFFDEGGAARPPDMKPSDVQVGDMGDSVDVWFDPSSSEVWEVAAADLSISPVHMAAVGKVRKAGEVGECSRACKQGVNFTRAACLCGLPHAVTRPFLRCTARARTHSPPHSRPCALPAGS